VRPSIVRLAAVAIAISGSAMVSGVVASSPTSATTAQSHSVPENCPYEDLRTPADASVQPGVIVPSFYAYLGIYYSAYSIDSTGHLTPIGADQTFLTTDHLVAAWQSSTDCYADEYSRNAWVADSSGAVIGESDETGPPANNYGDMAGKPLNQPIVGMSPTSDGNGYWLVASDGGIFSFGDAQFHGSMGGQPLNLPVVGMSTNPSGGGYWLVASDGGIFTFGNANFFGSMGGHPLNAPITGMTTTPDGNGYWMVASDGGVFCFGDAQFHGSMGGETLSAPIAGMIPNGSGYTLIGQDGRLYPFT
jgi:hypothetical protein